MESHDVHATLRTARRGTSVADFRLYRRYHEILDFHNVGDREGAGGEQEGEQQNGYQ